MRTSVLVLALVCLAGCSASETGSGSDDSSSSAGGGGPGTGGAGPVAYGTSDCGVCVHAECVAAFNACRADPECPAFIECLDACPVLEGGDADPACVDACPRGTGTESIRAAATIDACRDPGDGAKNCEACGIVPRGGVPDFPELNQTGCPASTETDGCFICQDEQCCQTQEACSADPECAAYKDCFRANVDGDNPFYDCGLQHPEGAALFAPAYVCAEYHCAVGMPTCSKDERDDCFTCLYDVCGTEFAALYRFYDGWMLSWCIGACPVGDDACDQGCYDLWPGARDEALQLGECLVAGCNGVC